MKWIPYGPHALLLQFADRFNESTLARCRALVAELETNPPIGLVDFCPALTTLLLEFDPARTPDLERLSTEVMAQLKGAAKIKTKPPPPREIPVVYDGPDLDRVAQAHQLKPEDVVRLHSERVYKVYMLGFAPGFPYLGDLNPKLHTPRLDTPRTHVPAGSVAIGGEHAGIYPVDSPGGWNLIGRTDAVLFNPQRRDDTFSEKGMFLLKQGDLVKFIPKTDSPAA